MTTELCRMDILSEVNLDWHFTASTRALFKAKLTLKIIGDACLFGNRFNASEALEIGLIDKVAKKVTALCISVLMSGYFTRIRKQEMKKMSEEASRSTPGSSPNPKAPPPPQKKRSINSSKSKNGGWASFMLPFYSLGILAYIVYVVGKIMSKKYSNLRKNSQIEVSWNKDQRSKGKAKTKLTMYELQQLEQKLEETEAAVQQIFAQTCQAVESANKALASSSDEEYSARPTKRLKKVTMAQSDSTDEASNSKSESMPLPQKLKPTKTEPHFHSRRIKRTRRRVRKDKSETSPSNSEPENPASVGSRDSDDGCTSSEDGDSFQSGNTHKDDLIQSAKNIHQTMSELQSYIDGKRVELEIE